MRAAPISLSAAHMPSRVTSILFVLVLALSAASAADWPGFRGPEGLGVAPDTAAPPERWDAAGTGWRWQTAIPGAGTSSPIAVDGRVYVTTAYEGPSGGALRVAVTAATVGLALAVPLWIFIRLRRSSDSDASGRPAPGRGVSLVSFLFVLVAVAVTLWPDLFFSLGNPGRTWRTTGVIALLGLAAAFGWFDTASRWRIVGVVTLLAGAAFIAYLTPASKVGPAPLEKRLTFALPALIGAFLYARGYFRARSRAQGTAASPAPFTAAALATLALLVFVPANYLSGLLRVVVCLDLESGEVLWERAALTALPEQTWPGGTYATPTPVTDGELVFAYFGAGIAALDREGEVRWVRRFPEYTRYARYGAGISPVLAGAAVIVVRESEAYQGGPASWIVALDRETGATLWRISPERARDSYGTPLVVESAGTSQLLTASWEFMAAYDTTNGDELWSMDYPMMQVVASLARDGDVFTVGGGAHGDKYLMTYRLDSEQATRAPRKLWQSNTRVPRVASPLFYEGLLFTVTDAGIMTAYDAVGGDEVWKQRLDGEHFASLVAGNGKVYAINTEGATSVVAAAREFELLAVNQLDQQVYATPAIADDCLLIRTAHTLLCIDGEATTETGSTPG